MSEKLKSDYVKHMENVEPSDAFLSQLTQTLKDEQSRQKRIKIRRIKQIVAMAAGLLLFFGISAIIYAGSPNRPHISEGESSAAGGMKDYVGTASSESITTIAFENINWYDDSLTGVSVPKALAQKLASSLDYLSFGSENRFVNAERADDERTRQIIELLSGADETAEEISGTKLYYMAVFTDGTVAKFSITNDTLIEISGDEKSYKKAEN